MASFKYVIQCSYEANRNLELPWAVHGVKGDDAYIGFNFPETLKTVISELKPFGFWRRKQ